jgi:hypothetical protein
MLGLLLKQWSSSLSNNSASDDVHRVYLKDKKPLVNIFLVCCLLSPKAWSVHDSLSTIFATSNGKNAMRYGIYLGSKLLCCKQLLYYSTTYK